MNFDTNTLRIIKILEDSFLPLLTAGLKFTVPLTLISFILGLLLALVTALARISNIKPLELLARFYVSIIRGTPLLVQLFIIFFGLPTVGVTIKPLTAAIIGFTLSVGAYNSEVIRAAILSIPKGQWEAASSIGMTYTQSLVRVVLPQAARVSVPPLANSFISLVKDTSLAATITVAEMFQVAQRITATTYEPLWMYIEAAFIYYIFCSLLTLIQHYLEKKLARYTTR
ncbi:cystine transport system permease protein [Clostridium acetobutylicum]|uniref:Amino acid ABC-type transporter, permease component n=1 Tax=Clostridium acetobutylicum (strain ATCC 824 / DSM 792 / JCM 1419 / IAM 19013 / LMG 5710 / NBRC 13948 / NRRL B-527 / VKM B-1787 / 2291 / W) TaxID=272562 RepID=Q97DZ4_CLOAB|nr:MULTISPECIES: amino acid ABC transporter permease [Clostridium]AAK81258.1 Amino acid ABC-type transporter, permease component [Clostridium acetobutylicum ATCC 824]ADZ22366.1 Amino acid ABC-type transporter, permease component [Clostridium acetobutylicum EA 2018]AEI33921.1 amino acid ABC transporter permease [Clostridium acetobutylicum DSM 1731]AWV81074.1 amino acid ABC transporter permease [Clostridium acetobutylicum]MBC2395590.1 amino acid ABC transporter permease [Clostridium acetobutylic